MLCIEFGDDGGEIGLMTNFPVVDSWQPPGSPQGNKSPRQCLGSSSYRSDWPSYC